MKRVAAGQRLADGEVDCGSPECPFCGPHRPEETLVEETERLVRKDSSPERRFVGSVMGMDVVADPSVPPGQMKLEMPERKVEDFDGKVDGGGYKASFDNPAKVPLALIDPLFLAGMGRVLQHGARKYAPGNWMRGMSFMQVISAIQRHTNAINAGEDIDPDTGELHVYHLACEVMFLARFMELAEYRQFDDRLFKARAPEVGE